MATKAKQSRPPAPSQFESFDAYLDARGMREQVEIAVEKRVIALQLDRRRKECNISKAGLAKLVGTSRTQIDRILDPASSNISVATLNRAARALGKKVHYELVDL